MSAVRKQREMNTGVQRAFFCLQPRVPVYGKGWCYPHPEVFPLQLNLSGNLLVYIPGGVSPADSKSN